MQVTVNYFHFKCRGSGNSNGSWSGMIGELQKKKADIGKMVQIRLNGFFNVNFIISKNHF